MAAAFQIWLPFCIHFLLHPPASRATGSCATSRNLLPARVVEDTAALPIIDPNGRFATTYRPGRGHLAWFDAALSRSDLPPSVQQLVADVGSHYAPDMPAPHEHALALRADLERAALPPDGGPLQMRITLRSSAEAPGPRPPLSVHVLSVVDVVVSKLKRFSAADQEDVRAMIDLGLVPHDRLFERLRSAVLAYEADARAGRDLPFSVASLHRIERDLFGVGETDISLPAFIDE